MFTTRIELQIEIVQKTSPALQNTFKMRDLDKFFRKTSELIEENPTQTILQGLVQKLTLKSNISY